MGAQKGKDLLLKLASEDEYITIAGLRARSISFNSATVDITHTESSGQWRELLDCGGIKRAALSGSGIFKDHQSDAQVRTLFFSGYIRPWQIIIPDFGSVSGPFQITALEYSGQHDSELTFTIALESAGELIFAAS